MNRNIAAVVYAARRSQVSEGTPAPFEELSSDEREPLLAEVREYLQSGTPMQDALGQAITDALK